MMLDLRPSTTAAGHRPRRGFTLIELLVVIAILAILASLAAWGVFATIGGRRRANTEATIKTVHKVLLSHWTTVIKEADKEIPSAAVIAMASINGTPDPLRAKVIWRKIRLIEAFPVTYAEITNPTVYQNYPATSSPYIEANRRRYIKQYQGVIGGAAGTAQSSACLLIALGVARGGNNALSPDQIGFAVKDTDGDGIKEIADDWGNPMAFYRFPYNNIFLAKTNPSPTKFNDPLDNKGLLLNINWYFLPSPPAGPNTPNPDRQRLEAMTGYQIVDLSGTPLTAYYTQPVLVSSGPDGVMGLGADLLPGAGANDNIYSFNLRLE